MSLPMPTGRLKVYIAAKFEQQAEVCDKATELEHLGMEVTSRWRFEDGTIPLAACAQMDLDDVKDADVLLLLTSGGKSGGGKHVETGYAIALGKRVIMVGPKENVFHNLPVITIYDRWEQAIDELLTIVDTRKSIDEYLTRG
jgi:nucleoside 2-deoxyribosyltransferase